MRYLLTTLLVAVYATLVCARPTITDVSTPDDDPVDTYDVIPYPGAEIIQLNGTISDVYAQILEINPNYEEDRSKNSTKTESELNRRDAGNDNLHCWKKINRAWGFAIADGIEYLRKFDKLPGLSANTCKQVSCSDDSAIHWCNDRPTFRVLPSWDNVADGAQVILNGCEDSRVKTVAGWLDHDDDWRVFVDNQQC